VADRIDVAEFRTRVDTYKVQCLLCPYTGHSLVSHLAEKHKMSGKKYLKEYPQARLASPIILELLKKIDRKNLPSADLEPLLPSFVFDSPSEPDKAFDITKKYVTSVIPETESFLPEEIQHFHFDRGLKTALVAAAVTEKNVYVSGPTGCGKTEGVLQVYNRLNAPIHRINMNGDVTVRNFLGYPQADPVKGTYFSYGALPNAMRGGYPLLADEIDYMPPHIAAVLSSVLEGGKTLYISETGETIKAAKGFKVIATANTGGKGDGFGIYTGTEVLNSAFLDRFSVKISVGYLPPDVEEKMLRARFPDADRKEISLLVKVANEVRQVFLDGQLSISFSTRKIIDFFELKLIINTKEAIEFTLLNWFDDDDQEVVRQILDRVGLDVT